MGREGEDVTIGTGAGERDDEGTFSDGIGSNGGGFLAEELVGRYDFVLHAIKSRLMN